MKLIEKTIGVRPDGNTIVQYALDLSEKKKPGRKKANIDPDVLAAYVIGGFSYSEIGRKLKKSEGTIRRYVKMLELDVEKRAYYYAVKEMVEI